MSRRHPRLRNQSKAVMAMRGRSVGSGGRTVSSWGFRSSLGLKGHAKGCGLYPTGNEEAFLDFYRGSSRAGECLKKSLFKLPREQRDESY